MRTDFREERRWKLALAHRLAHAVVEWHEAGTLEERLRLGICVDWKRPRDEEVEMNTPAPEDAADNEAGLREEEEEGGGMTGVAQDRWGNVWCNSG